MGKYVCLIAMLCTSIMVAQDCKFTLTGTIQDFHDGTPIAGATIYMKNIERYTTSNIDGYFVIDGQNISSSVWPSD